MSEKEEKKRIIDEKLSNQYHRIMDLLALDPDYGYPPKTKFNYIIICLYCGYLIFENSLEDNFCPSCKGNLNSFLNQEEKENFEEHINYHFFRFKRPYDQSGYISLLTKEFTLSNLEYYWSRIPLKGLLQNKDLEICW